MVSKDRDRLIGIDLFCGAGGMSLGFEQAGFEVVAAFDCDPINTSTYVSNFPSAKGITVDLSRLSGCEIRQMAGLRSRQTIDVLFGGPPCQGFSLIGKRRMDDPRNQLLLEFARLVRELMPSYFVVENVAGLLAGDARLFLESFLRRVRRAGFTIVEPITALNAADFGIPENRRRVFVIGFRKGMPSPELPIPDSDNQEPPNPPRPTVWDAIGDLPDIDQFDYLVTSDVLHTELGKPSGYASELRGEAAGYSSRMRRCTNALRGLSGCLRTLHSHDTMRRFSRTAPGHVEPVSRLFRLAKESCSPTIRAGTGPSHGSFTAARPIHPVYHRCISVREAARIHSFPDWFSFHPTKWHGFRQVGNSVPPRLARVVASAVLHALTA